MKEASVQQRIRLLAAQNNIECWRNNSGAFKDDNGRMIRYGLANESAQINEIIKSSDLICCVPRLITPDMLGTVVGVFTAVETKASDWRFSQKDKRAVAQAAFHAIVHRAGGYAGFATCPEDLLRITGLDR